MKKKAKIRTKYPTFEIRPNVWAYKALDPCKKCGGLERYASNKACFNCNQRDGDGRLPTNADPKHVEFFDKFLRHDWRSSCSVLI